MFASATAETITTRRKCPCGRFLVPHSNGTIPRHTRINPNWVLDPTDPRYRPKSDFIRCPHVGTVFPAIARERGKKPSKTVAVGRKPRGGHRDRKRNTKGVYRRNAAGGYTGRPGSAGS